VSDHAQEVSQPAPTRAPASRPATPEPVRDEFADLRDLQERLGNRATAALVASAVSGGGQPLGPSLRAEMERRFTHDSHGPIFRSVEDDAAEFERREQALSSLDWMASITPAVDDAPVMIAWAQRSAERFYQPDTRDRKRGYIAEGIVKLHDRLVGKAAQAKRGADGALLEVSPFGTESAWTPQRPASVAEIPPFSAAEMAQWHTAAEVFAQEAVPQRRGKGRGRKPGREVQTPQGRRVETFRVINSITFTKREGMTAATDEGQAEILWLHIAATHPGLTGDQVAWIVNQIGVRRAADEYRLTPQWRAEFEKAEPGTRITVTNSDAFDLDVVRATARLPSQHDLMVEGFRQGVVDAAGGMILAYGVFGIGVIALTGGMAVGGLAALGGEVTVSGIAAGGAVASEGAGFWTMAGVGARYGGQYLVLNGPALWNTVSSYGGALLTGAAIGDRLYNEGLHLSNLPDYLTDLGPLVEGAVPKLPELPRLSGFAQPDEGGTSLIPRRGPGLRGGGGQGGSGGPGGDGEPDLLIIPPRLDKATGKIRSSVTDLRGGGTYDAEVDPITRNGTIVRRDSGEVVGNIRNGVPSPVGTDPPAGRGAVPAPALPASRDAQPAGAPPQPRPRARGWADFLPFLDVARRSQQASQEKYGLRPEHLAMDTNATKPPASAGRFGGDARVPGTHAGEAPPIRNRRQELTAREQAAREAAETGDPARIAEANQRLLDFDRELRAGLEGTGFSAQRSAMMADAGLDVAQMRALRTFAGERANAMVDGTSPGKLRDIGEFAGRIEPLLGEATTQAALAHLQEAGTTNPATIAAHLGGVPAEQLPSFLRVLADPLLKLPRQEQHWKLLSKPDVVALVDTYGSAIWRELYKSKPGGRSHTVLERLAARVAASPAEGEILVEAVLKARTTRAQEQVLDIPAPPRAPRKQRGLEIKAARDDALWGGFVTDAQTFVDSHPEWRAWATRGENPPTRAQLIERVAIISQIRSLARRGQYDHLTRAQRLTLLDTYIQFGRETGFTTRDFVGPLNQASGALSEALFLPPGARRGVRLPHKPEDPTVPVDPAKKPETTLPDYEMPASDRVVPGVRNFVEQKSNRLSAETAAGANAGDVALAREHLDEAVEDRPGIRAAGAETLSGFEAPAGDAVHLIEYVRVPNQATREAMYDVLLGPGSPLTAVKFGDLPWMTRQQWAAQRGLPATAP